VALGLLCFAAGAIATFTASGLLDVRLLEYHTMDVWFEADVPLTFRGLTDRWAFNDRAKLHPLFGLALLPPVYLLKMLGGVEPWVAVRVAYAVVAGIWLAALFALVRLIGCRRFDATLVTLLGATSAGAMFWFPIPETHTLASPTILFAMIVVAVSAHRMVPPLLEVAVSAATLGVTVTNWMAGLLATVIRRPLSQTVRISAGAFALVCILWLVQRQVIPESPFFLGKMVGGEHILPPESHGALHVMQAFLIHSVVMPAIAVVDRPGAGQWPVMLIQPSNSGSAGVWSVISTLLWGGLLGAGLWATASLRDRGRWRLYLALLLVGQLLLHLLFGNETFLYTPNFLPVVLVVGAMAALTPARRAVLVVMATLVVTNAIGNAIQWRHARDFFVTFAPYRHDYAKARAARPGDPWPTLRGGVPLRVAPEGARIFETGFATTGGGFRPGLDQFVVSFWVLDDDGRLIATSDNLPPEQVTTRLTRRADSSVAALSVATPYYRAGWSPVGPRRWHLELTVPPGARIALAVRGVGPQRAPIRRLEWDGQRLLVNDRWSIEPSPTGVAAFLADENDPGWVSARSNLRQLSVVNGWAAARLELPRAAVHRIVVRDTSEFGSVDRLIATLPGAPAALVPERR
jgi:hypothetical protein